MLNKCLHLGNQCDQRFSILADAFTANITTIEELIKLMKDAPMTPKAVVRKLDVIYNWKGFVEEQLSEVPLENHSKYNSFLLSREDSEVKLRAKRLPQDEQLVPRAGIKLMKTGHSYGPVKIANLRVERLNFDLVMRGLNVYLSDKPLDERMRIQSSWDALRKSLLDLPSKVESFPKMILTDLPQVKIAAPSVPRSLVNGKDLPDIKGELFPERAVMDAHLEDEVREGMDVCIFTKDKRTRPWLGRILKILKNKKFILQWYARKSSRSTEFKALTNADGSPSIAELENSTVMFWMISEPQSRKPDRFSVSNYWLLTIMKEYEEIDKV